MKKSTLFFVFALFYSAFTPAQNKFNVYYSGESKSNTFNFDKFIFAHNFFADAFYRTDLYKQLNAEEMAQIIETVRQRISKDNAIKFVFPQTSKPNAELIFSIQPETKDGPILILSTNFDQENRKFSQDNSNHLVRWYFIRENLVIYRKNLFNKEDEEKWTAEKEIGELIELYLFDEIKSNNAKIEGLLSSLFSDTTITPAQKLYGYLYQQEYYLSQGNLEQALNTNKLLNDFYSTNEGKGIENNYSLLRAMANTEIAIMQLLN
ncbi:MAG: hypothetical protein RLZZ500_2232 [Bacteroidota bacterium]|jgi:hypothetical protein